jgi:hypothetical protein
MIDKEVRDEKAVKLAIGRIHKGEYTIVHKDPALQEQEEQAILAGINRPYEEYRYDAEEDELTAEGEEADEAEEGALSEETDTDALLEDPAEEADEAADGEDE